MHKITNEKLPNVWCVTQQTNVWCVPQQTLMKRYATLLSDVLHSTRVCWLFLSSSLPLSPCLHFRGFTRQTARLGSESMLPGGSAKGTWGFGRALGVTGWSFGMLKFAATLFYVLYTMAYEHSAVS